MEQRRQRQGEGAGSGEEPTLEETRIRPGWMDQGRQWGAGDA